MMSDFNPKDCYQEKRLDFDEWAKQITEGMNRFAKQIMMLEDEVKKLKENKQ